MFFLHTGLFLCRTNGKCIGPGPVGSRHSIFSISKTKAVRLFHFLRLQTAFGLSGNLAHRLTVQIRRKRMVCFHAI